MPTTSAEKKKICIITTVTMTVDYFIKDTFKAYHDNGYEVCLMCNMDEEYIKNLPPYVKPLPVKMERGVSLSGVGAMFKMLKIFKKEKFDIVQYTTPNASLYASIASFLARVPVRLYCQWGLLFVSFEGIKRKIFKFIEKFTCSLSTFVAPDSFGNLKLCREMGFYSEEKSGVVYNGSACGVDLTRFDNKRKAEYRKAIREQYGFSDDDIVMGFLGRLMKDKGFDEMMGAFDILKEKHPNLKLFFVGYEEKSDREDPKMLELFYENPRVVRTGGRVYDPERYMAAMDIYVFPSYREGFGTVVIESAAMELPLVISDIPGPTDGVIRDETAFVVPVKTVEPLAEKIEQLILDKELREKMGKAGRKLVEEKFDSKNLIGEIVKHRNSLIEKARSKK